MEKTEDSALDQGCVYFADPAYTRVLCPRCDDYKAVDKGGRVICICGYNETDGRWVREIDVLYSRA